MAKETEPAVKGPHRFVQRIRVFILAELVLGLLFTTGGWILIGYDRPYAGIGTMITGVWVQVSLMIWRCISYQVAQLLEIAPSLKQLSSILSGRT